MVGKQSKLNLRTVYVVNVMETQPPETHSTSLMTFWMIIDCKTREFQ